MEVLIPTLHVCLTLAKSSTSGLNAAEELEEGGTAQDMSTSLKWKSSVIVFP